MTATEMPTFTKPATATKAKPTTVSKAVSMPQPLPAAPKAVPPPKSKAVVKPLVKAATKPAAAPAGAAQKKAVVKAVVPKVKPAKAAKPVKAPKPKKPKMVRDSMTMPKAEYAVIDELKLRAAKLDRPVKKTELLRAGIKALAAMADTGFLVALKAVPSLKTGRPSKS